MTPTSADRRARVLYLLSHPIQYQAPLLRHLSQSDRVAVHTIFVRDLGTKAYFDRGFGTRLQWDVPLTEGYSHEFLPSFGPTDRVTRLTPVLRGLGAAARRWRPHAVWVHGYDHLNAVRLLAWAKRHQVRTLVRAEVEWSDAHGRPRIRAVKDLALRRAFPLIDGFLTIGRQNSAFYADHGVPSAKLFPAPYAVDNARFAALRGSGTPDELSRAHGLSPGRPVFLFAGKLIERKRPLDAVRAVARLRDRHHRDANLVLVGSGDQQHDVEKEIAHLGVADRVSLAGFMNQQEIVTAYSRCSALLLTSERERWGLVANEAMAAGAPVIAYRSVGCAGDLVEDGLSGRVVDTADIDQLAGAMRDLSDEPRRNQLSAGAIRRVEQFSFAAIEAGLVAALGGHA